MKIFSKYITKRLGHAYSLEQVLFVLEPWIRTKMKSPACRLMQQVAVHCLSNSNAKKKLKSPTILHYCVGHTHAPYIFKKVIAREISRLMDPEDLYQTIVLCIIIAYRKYDPRKGGDFVQYLARQIPYFMSYWVTYRVFQPLYPFEMFTEQPDLDMVRSELES